MAITKWVRDNEGNPKEVQMGAQEETEFLAHTADLRAKDKVLKDAEAQKATDKGTGNQKLLDLGLTQAEVDALTGR